MKYLISHRGNLTGPNKFLENRPDYIKKALSEGFDVEIDVWVYNGYLYLGHDLPQYLIDISFLKNEKLWCHAKNNDALFRLHSEKDIHYFSHDNDPYTLTSKKFIWCHPNSEPNKDTIYVSFDKNYRNGNILGICSDYIGYYKNIVNTTSDNTSKL